MVKLCPEKNSHEYLGDLRRLQYCGELPRTKSGSLLKKRGREKGGGQSFSPPTPYFHSRGGRDINAEESQTWCVLSCIRYSKLKVEKPACEVYGAGIAAKFMQAGVVPVRRLEICFPREIGDDFTVFTGTVVFCWKNQLEEQKIILC